jgi:hypothetical protein
MKPLTKGVALYCVVAIFLMGIVPRAYAGFCPSELSPVSQVDRTADLEQIRKVLEAKAVQARLAQLGFSQEEIQARLSQLSDQEIHRLACNLEDLRVGGNGAVAVLVILILVAIAVGVWFYVQGKKISVEPR